MYNLYRAIMMFRILYLGMIISFVFLCALFLLNGGCAPKKKDVGESFFVTAREPQKNVDVSRETQEKIVYEKPNISPVQFELNSKTLSDDALLSLGRIAAWLDNNQNIQITVNGYCCPIGSDEYNMALGQARADAVAEYLRNAGIDRKRIITKSYGEENLLTEDESEYWKNRRAEIVCDE